jgi:hypothetical protein
VYIQLGFSHPTSSNEESNNKSVKFKYEGKDTIKCMLVDVFKCTFLGMFLACNVNSYARNILWNCFFRISISFTNIINKNAVILALLDCLRDTTCVNLAVCLMKQEGLQMLKHLTKTTFDFF